MNIETLRRLSAFIILCLAQALVLNHIIMFSCATPLMYVYFIITLKRDLPKWATLLWSFAIGLCIDIFSNTPGLAASSATLLGLLQPYLLSLFIQRESAEDLSPSMKSLGTAKFTNFTVVCVLIYCITFFTVEAFSFFNWLQWLANIIGSTVLTTLLIIAVENVRKR